MPSNIQLADLALEEATKLIRDNRQDRELLPQVQEFDFLDTEEDLRKAHEELKRSESKIWFNIWGSTRSAEHLVRCQNFVEQIRTTIRSNQRASIVGRCTPSAHQSTSPLRSQISTQLSGLEITSDGSKPIPSPAQYASSTVSDADTDASSAYETALADAITTPLATSPPQTEYLSLLQPPSHMPSRPSSSPQPQHQPFQSPVDTTLFGARPDPSVLSSLHPPSAPALDAQTRKLAATLSKKALSGKPRGQPRTRFNGFAHMSDCIYLDSVSTADGITMNVGGYQNAGSVITKMPMPPIQHQEA